MNLDRIHHIIKFIEENYNREISIVDLEDIACYSYRNLQRVFKNIFGESIGEFHKRLKLENGYKKLLYTNDTITDIAFSVGFESLQAFTKSFKKQFSISPSASRLSKLEIFNKYLNSNEKESISREVIYINPITLYFQSIKTNNYDNNEIDILWENIDTNYGSQIDLNYFGIIVDQPLITISKHCRYEAGINQNPHSKTFSSKTIFGGRYIKYIHEGSYDLIENTYRLIYNDWLFNSKYELDDSPTIEHYVKHNFNCENENQFITEILLPLKKS